MAKKPMKKDDKNKDDMPMKDGKDMPPFMKDKMNKKKKGKK
jgi:hypothetical protein